MRKFVSVTIVIAMSNAPAWAAYDCSSSIDAYIAANQQVTSTLKRYISCLQNSAGKDDCNFEFRRVKSAQFDFESAVSDISINCE
ncbi:hypothetical protein [Sphingobium xenophagum]|uniref:hypothetical protein n=1 Tax=Sphingobium xenophagum TaxID=121428 RepID=UPI00035EA589|nr:hypothetical protein [Sphingobium xenophagum]